MRRALVTILLLAAADATGQPPSAWWNDAVFYEVFVRCFQDSTDGPLADDGVGDLRGLIERLDYLNDGDPTTDSDLGVTGVWLMPLHPATTPAGYAITDHYRVHPDYGTLADLRELIAEAHARGIRVVTDLVLNHISHRHPWFTENLSPTAPRNGDFVWRDAPQDEFGDVWAARWKRADASDRWYYARFAREPDLNLHSPAARDELFKIARFWIDDVGVDGFRLDAIKHLYERAPVDENLEETHAWLREFHAMAKRANPVLCLVGEVWDTIDVVAAYGPDQMDMNFQFGLAEAIVESVDSGRREPVADELRAVAAAFEPNQYATFLSNHDQTRVMTVLGGDAAKMRLAATLLLTGPGVPFVYYGEEIGMPSDDDTKAHRRGPMRWSAAPGAGFSTVKPWREPPSTHGDANVAGQRGDADSLLSHYRELIHLRNRCRALRRGVYEPLRVVRDSGEPAALFAFARVLRDESVLVVANLGEDAIDDYTVSTDGAAIPTPGSARELLTGMTVEPPKPSSDGSFTGYRPVSAVGPRSASVIHLPAAGVGGETPSR